MMSGSARLPRIEGMASLRQTRKWRRQTATKRGLSACGAKVRAFIDSVPQIPAGELQEHVLEARRPVHVAELFMPAQGGEPRLDVLGIAKHGLADALAARRERAGARGPGVQPLAVHLDHLRLDMPRDQRARRAFGDDATAVHDRDARAKALGLLHEMRRQHDGAALGRRRRNMGAKRGVSARVGLDQPEAKLERRRLAGAVGAERAEAPARRDLQIDACHDLELAVAFPQALRLQRKAHRQLFRTMARRMFSRRWKKWSAPGTTMTGRSCGSAHASTAASGAVSSFSPWMSSVSAGTGGAGNLFTASPTRTMRSGGTTCASLVCIAAPNENPARAGLLLLVNSMTAARSSTSPRPSSLPPSLAPTPP